VLTLLSAFSLFRFAAYSQQELLKCEAQEIPPTRAGDQNPRYRKRIILERQNECHDRQGKIDDGQNTSQNSKKLQGRYNVA